MSRGLDVIEHDNADLWGEGAWTGTPATADGHSAPLPVYPQPADLPDLAEQIREADKQFRFAAALFGGGCMLAGAIFSLLIQAVLS